MPRSTSLRYTQRSPVVPGALQLLSATHPTAETAISARDQAMLLGAARYWRPGCPATMKVIDTVTILIVALRLAGIRQQDAAHGAKCRCSAA